MHKSNSLFSTQPMCFSSCFFSCLFSGTLLKTLETCTSVNCFHPSEAKGTTRKKVLLLLHASAATEIPEGPGANSSPEPVEQVSRKAACQICFPGRLIKIGHDSTPISFCGCPPSVKAQVKPVQGQSSDTLVQTPVTDLNSFPFQFSYFPSKILHYQNQF